MNIKQLREQKAASLKARLTATAPEASAQTTEIMSYQDMIKQQFKYKPLATATRPEYKLYLTVGHTQSKKVFATREDMVAWYKEHVNKTIDSVTYVCIAGYTIVHLTAILKTLPKAPVIQVPTVKDEFGNSQVCL